MIHIYTGDGKGKTTAAFGLAMRKYGRGGKVLISQFLKPELSGEALVAEGLGIEIIYRTEPRGFIWEMDEENRHLLYKSTQDIFLECKRRVKDFDMLVMDEIICAVGCKMIDEEEVLCFLAQIKYSAEVVLTGRGAGRRLIGAADYVSEIKCIKHPFEHGAAARKGIEF